MTTRPWDFEISIPPSVNRLWRAVGGRVIKSKAYRTWAEEASYRLHSVEHNQDVGLLDGPVAVHIEVPTSCRQDIDNVPKAVLDALEGRAYKNDRQVEALHVERVPPRDGREAGLLRVCVHCAT